MSEMKKLLESLQECGMNDMPAAAPMDQGNPVSMNVSINASGKEHVADLIDMMKNAGLSDAKPAADAMMPVRMDMERLRDVVDGPKMEGDNELMSDCCDAPLINYQEDLGTGICSDCKEHSAPMQDESLEEYDNEPDPEYQDHKFMTKDLSGGLNREKKAYKAAQDGDNAMAVEAIVMADNGGNNPLAVEAIKTALYKALEEKKAKPDFLDMDGDGDKEEPMKKAVKDKKAKKDD